MFEYLLKTLIVLNLISKAVSITSTCNSLNVTYSTPSEKTLFSCLFDDYDTRFQPPSNKSDQLKLYWTTLWLASPNLENDGQASMQMTLELMWMDDWLQWDPIKFAGIKHIYVPINNIWRPQLEQVNRGSWGSLVLEEMIVKVSSNGIVQWIPRLQLHIHMEVDPTFFPHDTRIFQASFSVDAPSTRIQIIKSNAKTLTGVLWLKYEWSIKFLYNNVHLFPMDLEGTGPHEDLVTYVIVLERLTNLQDLLLVCPVAVLGLFIMVLLWVPHHSGQRFILSTVFLLACLVIKSQLHQLLPSGLTKVPIIVSILTYEVVLLFMTFLVSLVSASLCKKASGSCKLPEFVEKVFLNNPIKRLVCLNNHGASCSSVPNPNAFEFPSQADSNKFEVTNLNLSLRRILSGMERRHYDGSGSDWHLLSLVIDRLFFLIFLLLSLVVVLILISHKQSFQGLEVALAQ